MSFYPASTATNSCTPTMSSLSKETLIVRGGSLPTESLVKKIGSLVGGNIEISAQALLESSAWATIRSIIFEGDTAWKKCCVTTPHLAEEQGLMVLFTPSEADPYHCDVRCRSQITDANADTLEGIAHQFQAAFRGPFLQNEVNHEWTTDNIRGLQRPFSAH